MWQIRTGNLDFRRIQRFRDGLLPLKMAGVGLILIKMGIRKEVVKHLQAFSVRRVFVHEVSERLAETVGN